MSETIRVLLVDDQVLFVHGLRTVLEVRGEGISVVGTAGNGREALELVPQLRPDVVLMDVRMPVMDGVEATRLLRESHPEVNIMMLTTFDDDTYVTEALNHGAAGYVLKDIPPDQLVVSIRAVHNGSVLISPQVAKKLLRQRDTPDDATGAEAEPHAELDAADAHGDPADKGSATAERPARVRESGELLLRNQDADDEYPADSGENEIGAAAAPTAGEEHSLLRYLSRREVEVLRLIGEGYDNALIARKLHIAEQTVKNHVSVIYSKLNVHDRIRVMKLATNYRDYLGG